LLADGEDCGSAPALGDGTFTYMSELALEEELLNDRDDLEWVSLSFSLFIILQKLTEQQKLVEWVRK